LTHRTGSTVNSQRASLRDRLAGTSVAVTAGGYTLSAPIVYTLGTQVAAVMPSATVVGPATIAVTYNGFK